MCVRATRRWRSKEEEEEERKNPRITKESLRRICKEQKLYITPHLNDVLYLHYKGYSKIENLEEYTGLKCLWLENNGIDKIENLDNQKDLRNLYLHNNLIKEIENLEGACPLLDSLNLCHNSVSKIQNLSGLEHLHTLHISHNRLQDFADVEHLKECKELSCVDLQHNWLDDPNIVDIFEAMPSLRVLYLTGNPVVKKIPFYRKNLTVRCKKLTYLDDRPVFPKDRAAAEAWNEGGLEAEKACRKKWAEEERAKIDASVKGLLALRDKAKAAKFKAEMEELALPTESEKKEEEEEEESDEDEEEEKAEDLDSHENLEAGDSEEVTQNGIIFPWNVEPDLRDRNRNELGEGGRSLIVELPDPNQPEIKQVKSVGRKGPVDPEIKTKLQDALVSAEGLLEKEPEKLEETETKAEVEAVSEEPVSRIPFPAPEASDEERETKAEVEAVSEEPVSPIPFPAPEASDEEKETKAEVEAVSEEPVSRIPFPAPEESDVPQMEKEIKAKDEEGAEKETPDNLVKEKQFAYEQYVKKLEEEILPNIAHFSFGQKAPEEEEKHLGKEIEEMLRIEMEEKKKEGSSREEALEEIEVKLTEEVPSGVEEQKTNSQEKAPDLAKEVPKDFLRQEVALFVEKKLINEREATEVLNFGAKVVEKLRDIGKFPLKEKEATDLPSDSSSEDEFQDTEESPPEERFEAIQERSKLEPQESEEYYSLLAEEEEKEATSPHDQTTEEPPPEEDHVKTFKRDIKSSIELQIVTEAAAEGTDREDD